MQPQLAELPRLLLLALSTGFGLGCLALAAKSLATAARLWVRGLLVRGEVVPRAASDPRPGGLILFTDHLGQNLILDPGRHPRLRGVPPIGAQVPVVYPRNRPTAARPAIPRYLLLPPFAWFLAATVTCGAVYGATR